MKKTQNILAAVSAALVTAPFSAFAIDAVTPVEPTGDLSVAEVLTNLINWVLGFTAAVAVLFLIIGGLQYITSSGNKDRAEGAKKTILYAVIGLIVVALSFVIVAFVSRNVGDVVQ
jgi:hypothetical protein